MSSIGLPLAFLVDSLGGSEMVVIFMIVLVLFGGKKLPEVARGLGKSIREFKKAAAGVEEEFKRALEEDERQSKARTVTPAIPVAPVPEALPAASEPAALPAASESAAPPTASPAETPATPAAPTPPPAAPAPGASLTTPSPAQTPDTPPPAPDHPPEKHG